MSSKQQVLSPGAQLLVHLLQNHAKAGASVVLLPKIGQELKQQFKGYKKGCVRKLVKEITEKGLAQRKIRGGTASIVLTESGARFSAVVTVQLSLAKSARPSAQPPTQKMSSAPARATQIACNARLTKKAKAKEPRKNEREFLCLTPASNPLLRA